MIVHSTTRPECSLIVAKIESNQHNTSQLTLHKHYKQMMEMNKTGNKSTAISARA